jgi:hypothetical protein
MSRKNNVRLFDSSARNVLRHIRVAEAHTMVQSGVAFELSTAPLELCLSSSGPARKQVDIERLRPDQSLTVPPTVVRSSAAGAEWGRKIIASYGPNRGGKS